MATTKTHTKTRSGKLTRPGVASVLATLGRAFFGSHESVASVWTVAAERVNEMLGTDHALIVRQAGTGTALLVEANVGHDIPDCPPDAFDNHGCFGYVSSSMTPVMIEDVRSESRFTLPHTITDSSLVSGIAIRFGRTYESVGVLAAFSTRKREFDADDIACLEVIATLLGAALDRILSSERSFGDQEKITQAKLEWEATVDSLPHFICLLDENKHVVRVNRSVAQWTSFDVSEARGHSLHGLLHPQCTDPDCYLATFIEKSWDSLLAGQAVEHVAEDHVFGRYLSITLRPTSHRRNERKRSNVAVALFQDVTNVKRAEEVLKNYSERLEQQIQARTADLVLANAQLTAEIDERRRIEQTLRRSEAEMRLLSGQLLTAQEMERKRIAAELHDGIGQSLSAVKFSVESVATLCDAKLTEQERKAFERVVDMIRSAVEEVRKTAMELHPSTLTDLGIVPTIAWFSREFRSIYASIALDVHIELEESDVPAQLRTLIFRIMQEALNNVVRHARADRVQVRLSRTADAIELEVQDNGRGFDMQAHERKAPGTGFGIAGMKERAEFSGGTFAIHSGPSGTRVSVSWPRQR